ncbi:hypothetical protein JM64_06155 [Fervidobacterium ngatamarikiense]|uniref:J domain-containing protein n=1 Tax=Fervidobacterium pennivorans TaxID=93466 RepID=A0A172T3I9_FERPE|nr:hypothetical protein [Fervidobacterium pennivorans]ANE41588.1 hypothetical protein JM64_06155 [Fervidobacterium pennivorans]
MKRSIFELLNIPLDTPHAEIEILYKEYLEKYNSKRYENSELKPIAMAKYNELIEAYEAYKKQVEGDNALNAAMDNGLVYSYTSLRGYRPGYYYRRHDGCCDDICECIGCMWVGDTCCECMGGDCISCM